MLITYIFFLKSHNLFHSFNGLFQLYSSMMLCVVLIILSRNECKIKVIIYYFTCEYREKKNYKKRTWKFFFQFTFFSINEKNCPLI